MNLIKNFSIYTFVGLFSGMVGFIIMPILTHYLSPEDYGLLSLFNVYIALLIPFINFRTGGLLSIEYFNREKKSFSALFTGISLIPLPMAALFIIISLLFSSELETLIEIPSHYIFLIPVISLLTVYYQQISTFLTITKKAVLFGASAILKVLTEVSVALFLIILLGYNWIGRVESMIVSLSAFFLFALFYCSREKLINFSIRKDDIKAGLAFGGPLIFHYLSKIIINQSDRIFISKMVSVDEMGIYSTGYQIGSILLIIAGAFINVYNPFLFERLANITEQKKKEIIRLAYIFLFGLLLLLLVISLLTPAFYEFLINKRFAGGSRYVFWIGLSYFFWGGYLVFSGFIFYLKRTKILAYLALINIALNLGLNYLMILEFGAIGAAYATVISFVVIFILTAIISNRLYPMPWFNFKKIMS